MHTPHLLVPCPFPCHHLILADRVSSPLSLAAGGVRLSHGLMVDTCILPLAALIVLPPDLTVRLPSVIPSQATVVWMPRSLWCSTLPFGRFSAGSGMPAIGSDAPSPTDRPRLLLVGGLIMVYDPHASIGRPWPDDHMVLLELAEAGCFGHVRSSQQILASDPYR